jgi:WD repeat-containing protein 48
MPNTELTTPGGASQPATTPGEAHDPATPSVDALGKEASTPSKGLFGKKFSMGMSFSGMKKIGRTQTNDKDKPIAVEEKDETESDSRSSKTSGSRAVDDNLLGTIQKIRFGYDDALQQQIQAQHATQNGLPVTQRDIDLPTAITPSQPSDTPVLSPPPNTTILIQEDRPEAGGVADLFEGTVGALGDMADLVEKTAPMWLGEVLLRNQSPAKDVVKISFVLEPWENQLPSIASDGNNRLNANRMLRAKKIMAYVAERIEPAPTPAQKEKEEREGGSLKPEEYLELWCQNQVRVTWPTSRAYADILLQMVPPTMTLATIRSHIWRGGGDVILYFKANGRKPILHAPEVTSDSAQSPDDTGVPPAPPSESGSEARSFRT